MSERERPGVIEIGTYPDGEGQGDYVTFRFPHDLPEELRERVYQRLTGPVGEMLPWSQRQEDG